MMVVAVFLIYIAEVTHARPGGGPFPAVWYVGLVGVVSIA